MASPRRKDSASQEPWHRRTAGAAPDETWHDDTSRLSEANNMALQAVGKVGPISKASVIRDLFPLEAALNLRIGEA